MTGKDSSASPTMEGSFHDCGEKKDPFRHTSTTMEQVRYISEEAKKRGFFCQTYSGPDILAPRECEELQYYVKKTSMSYRISDDFMRDLSEPPHKMLMVSTKSRQELEGIRQAMLSWAEGQIEMIFSCDQYLEFLPAGVEKGNAVRELCRFWRFLWKIRLRQGMRRMTAP